MTHFSFRALVALAAALLVPLSANAQTVAIVGGAPLVQDFDSLANAGTSSVLPDGWYLSESDDNADGTYAANDGSTISGNTYSYGSGAAVERALGGLRSGSLIPLFGAQLSNQSGGTLSEIAVQFTGEQWRLGTVGRVDRLDFQFSLNATSLTDGTWTDVDSLDFTAPINAGVVGALDGNLLANKTGIAATIGGLSLTNGAVMWVRWSDFSATSNDDGLAIDDVSFAVPGDFPPTVVNTSPGNNATGVLVGSAMSVSFSEAVTATGAFSLSCVGAGAMTLNVSGGPTTYTLTPSTSLDFNDSCTLTVTAANVLDQDGTPDNMAADVTVDFSTEVDNAPTLSSSTPVDTATDFPANANLQLTFSEPVTLGANWFDIACNVSGARTPANVAVGGGPSAFSINPDADFTQGESCTLTLNAADITDQDGVADTLSGPNTITFTPAAATVNDPPVVLSTTPVDGDNSFPSAGDIVVLFSEPVTLSAGAFTLTCTASSGIVLGHASSGTSFTINTGTALIAEDDCVFTIHALQVADGEGANPGADYIVNFSVATSSAGTYYSTVNNDGGSQLRCTLHDIIKGHTRYPYGWTQLEIADEAPDNVCAAGSASSENYILDVYRNRCYDKIADRSNPVDAFHYNREHTWPKSLGFNDSGLAPHNDLHMLHLSASDWNGVRDNDPYDNCTSGCTAYGTDANNGVGGPGAEHGKSNWSNGSVFEVWDVQKGDMARAVMYMAIRYEGIASEDAHDGNVPDLELTDNPALVTITSNTAAKAYMGLLTTLLQWNTQDPPDARELERNEVVYAFQGNRNPFIDHPEWATMGLFTSAQPATCVPNTGGNTAPVAADDSYAPVEDTLLTVASLSGVLDNDSDADTDPLVAQLLTDVSSGVLSLAGDGSFTYLPAENFCGSDSFTYRAFDGTAHSAAATVTLNVACVNDAPVAEADSFNGTEDNAIVVVAPGVIGNDSDVENHPLSAHLDIDVAQGTLTLGSDGSFSYVPASDYCGMDSFSYHLDDGQALNAVSNSAVVVLNVACVNDAPVAQADSYAGTQDQALNIAAPGVLGNDSDVDVGDLLGAVLVSNPSNGGLTFNSDGSFVYTPDIGFCGGDSFSYHADDDDVNSGEVIVSLQISCTADIIFADGFE